MSIQALQNATGPKELHWIDGASHNDLYNKEQYVGPAITKLADFFTSNLALPDGPAISKPPAQSHLRMQCLPRAEIDDLRAEIHRADAFLSRPESAGVPGDPNYKAELTLAAIVSGIQVSA